MKKYAYYLPQFHEIPENDEWWGKGFTEWVNVKKAKPLYKGHVQPKQPLNDNYYTLTDPSVMKWQTEVAKEYTIDGMIFYHYYFRGKKLLEKPAEILLANKDIPMNFFFCWANHSWYRSWEGTKELLVEQTYGTEKDWERHFEYLLSFFKDERYEKIDNKPVLMIYDYNFSEFEAYIDFLDLKCKRNGFGGIHLILTIRDNAEMKNQKNFYAIRQPDASLRKEFITTSIKIRRLLRKMAHFFNKSYTLRYNGDKIYYHMILDYKKDIIPGLFFEWDNTPRHGYRGYVITPPSKETFMKYMDTIKDSEYVFINAWNEWCEGMMLEPTEENGYKYLEWIKEWSEKNENRTDGI